MNFASIRPTLFSLAIAALATSIAVLIGGYARHVQATDYIKQADEALPWVDCGSATAVIGFLLSFFGKRIPGIACVVVASLLVAYWCLIATSLY